MIFCCSAEGSTCTGVTIGQTVSFVFCLIVIFNLKPNIQIHMYHNYGIKHKLCMVFIGLQYFSINLLIFDAIVNDFL